jgi:4-hydroxy-tetrahydrodipicolinate reductase
MSLRIGIMGVGGRMGRLLAEEVAAAGAALAGGTVRAGGAAAPQGVPIRADAESLLSESDVAIDFTHASAAAAHAAARRRPASRWCSAPPACRRTRKPPLRGRRSACPSSTRPTSRPA